MTTTRQHDYYCNQKFWWLSVDLEKSRVQSCCAGSPHKIDHDWLSGNPGQLFNDAVFLQERQQMLANQPVASCESSCWQAERDQQVSRRISMCSDAKTHTDLICAPTTLNIIMGTQCNMGCVYCCKNYSSTWRNDILTNGDYAATGLDDRYQKTRMDQVLQHLGINDIALSRQRQQTQAATLHPDNLARVDTVIVGGGEPFLYDDLINTVDAIPQSSQLQIITGLGVNPRRFEKLLGRLAQRQITVLVSAEGIGSFYEFARHGNTWTRFLENIGVLQQSGLPWQYNATLSNVTVFGLVGFLQFAGDTPINYQACTDPAFLSMHCLDQYSKQALARSLDDLPDQPRRMVQAALEIEPSAQHITQFRSFIRDFARRRKLDLSIFPETLVSWIDQ